MRHSLSSVCPAESTEGDVPAENPAERERSSAAERGFGVSEGESDGQKVTTDYTLYDCVCDK